LAIIDEMGFIAGGDQRGTAADIFRRIYWDTALAASDPVLGMLRDVAGIDRSCMAPIFRIPGEIWRYTPSNAS
jgi:hypothetical protein